MLKIYDIETARDTILRREPLTTAKYPPALIAGVEQIFGEGVRPEGAVTHILETVHREGDAALKHWTKILDDTEPADFRVPVKEFKAAYERLAPSLAQSLRIAADRIRNFHERQPLPNWTTTEMGGVLGQRATPVERAGVYIPGGSAPLPSSLLMSVIPAQVAGVERIIVATPPSPHDTILAAAHICDLDEVYQIGGAQAVAALAFGTESIPKVDTIVGAGNLFVTLAKQRVYGIVGLDGLAGPTETMIIADDTANPAWVAADLLAQAEHDPLASAILLTTSRPLAESVQAEVTQQMETLSRTEIIAQSLESRSGIVLTPNLATAADLANTYAAEHLCLAVEDPQCLSESINNAGGFFLGDHSFEVLGDYVAGPSHIMPTGGSARFASPLNVMDFVKINSVIALDSKTAAELSPLAAEIAHAESLTAHAASAEWRIQERDSECL